MSNHDERPTSDFPEELLTPVRRHTESQALIRLEQENTGPIDPLDGPEIEPLVPLANGHRSARLGWLPWALVASLLILGVVIWVLRARDDDKPSRTPASTTATPSDDNAE